ncbi:hypothetical protein H6P81_009164 [Aristolochia fimbriata]|uniref:Uncharacterized protein n=1 Tax=Aristolochia fimbriata TaxID=158543 RepID=A0AAV7ELF9_ARIFI|nr:hypothetical protein H6P81_009164 [Aristolochia fimbriata]
MPRRVDSSPERERTVIGYSAKEKSPLRNKFPVTARHESGNSGPPQQHKPQGERLDQNPQSVTLSSSHSLYRFILSKCDWTVTRRDQHTPMDQEKDLITFGTNIQMEIESGNVLWRFGLLLVVGGIGSPCTGGRGRRRQARTDVVEEDERVEGRLSRRCRSTSSVSGNMDCLIL